MCKFTRISILQRFPVCAIALMLCIVSANSFGQKPNHFSINWQKTQGTAREKFSFSGAVYLAEYGDWPCWQTVKKNAAGLDAVLLNPVYEPLLIDESYYPDLPFLGKAQPLTTAAGIDRRVEQLIITIFPYRLNPVTRKPEKLVSFDLSYNPGSARQSLSIAHRTQAATSSVLASGDWYKIAVTADGIYKVTYDNLRAMDFNLTNVNLNSVRLFGNGGGMLPLKNSDPRADDLVEDAIQVVDADQNGAFNTGDYFLFYGQGQTKWTYSTTEKRFVHQKNNFSDSTFYFVTINGGSGPAKRINTVSSLTPDGSEQTITSFTDYAYHEEDIHNFIKSGRNWYGEAFDINLNQVFTFNFPSAIVGSTGKFKSSVIARTSVSSAVTVGSTFVLRNNGNNIGSQFVPFVGTRFTDDFARGNDLSSTFTVTADETSISYTFQPYNSSSTGWLNYISLNVQRNLNFNGNELFFRDADTSGITHLERYLITNAPVNDAQLWNISSSTDVNSQRYQLNGSTLEFLQNVGASAISNYVLFTSQAFRPVILAGKVPNQDLHALPEADLIIVVNPEYLDQAQRLADFHTSHDSLRTIVAVTTDIYNEFSSGAQDVAAIRDFVKMFYDRAQQASDLPRYVLLFGDGSYDMKYRLSSNSNKIPTFQSDNSISLISSYTSDDFFGMMDPLEGTLNSSELMDVSVGRFPVRTPAEAKTVVDKVISYADNNSPLTGSANTTTQRLGEWRNVMCFVADDQDRNLHLDQSERILRSVAVNHPVYNLDKIALDAYQQISTPGGERYPEVNDAINKRIEKGTFLMNYTGHGGELGWAAEAILTTDMIRSWKNSNSLAAFITATCEFSRYDDPGRTSAGELVLLNPEGGGICLFTTVRLAFAADNELINNDLLNYMLQPLNGSMPRIGDIMRLTKRDNPSNRNVTLLGDPALRLAYPEYKVNTTSVINTATGLTEDTLSALSRITINGNVTDASGNLLSGFNGIVYPAIYDKAVKISTLVNNSTGDDISLPDSFLVRKNILYKGKASVVNGTFTCSFIIPRDIAYTYGNGRISYYAQNGITDANGYDESLVIGGTSSTAINDDHGPQIRLFMNSDKFVFGGLTDQTPHIYALLSDSSGINTVGNGIGHDLTALLDGQTQKLYVLNDYYESDLNSFQSGKINYPLASLSEGRHTLLLKAWDINNNSSQAETEFIVASDAKIALDHVLNYPNPFTTHTSFFFEHNKPFTALNVQVLIYTVSGKLVKTIDSYFNNESTRETSLSWDGRDEYGDQLARGVYIYRLKINTAAGETAEKLEKLVILR